MTKIKLLNWLSELSPAWKLYAVGVTIIALFFWIEVAFMAALFWVGSSLIFAASISAIQNI